MVSLRVLSSLALPLAISLAACGEEAPARGDAGSDAATPDGGAGDTGMAADTGMPPVDASPTDAAGDSAPDAAGDAASDGGGGTGGAPCSGSTCVVDISAGDRSTCAVRFDGRIYCWGANEAGQLGDGTMTDSSRPRRVAGVSGAVDVEVGLSHACAILSDDTVACWGRNDFGQLGDGSTTNRTSPVTATGVTDVVELDLGGFEDRDGAHRGLSAARRAGGAVYEWGAHVVDWDPATSFAQHEPMPTAALVADLTATEISVGGAHICVIDDMGETVCWGDNHLGQIGSQWTGSSFIVGLESVLVDPTRTHPGTMDLPTGGLSAGALRSCAIVDGQPTCWGLNIMSSTAMSPYVLINSYATTSIDDTPTGYAPAGDLITSGFRHDCFVEEGQVHCRSGNDRGQVGDGTLVAHYEFSPTAALTEIAGVSAGLFHTCAVDDGGDVYCWGGNDTGQIGDGTRADRSTPVLIAVVD